MESYFSYTDKLCVQFMARLLQFKHDHKADYDAIKLTEQEFHFKINHDASNNHSYMFIDNSVLIHYGNNKWEAYDY